jgi:tetratricopeptide (TPR) repeat protein
MAWRSLWVLHSNSNRYGPASEALERAYAFRNRLSERERLTVTSSYHKQNHEYALAEAAYLQRLESEPENGAVLVGYADLLLETGRWAEAESLSLRGAELLPRAPVAYWNAVEAQVTQRRFRAADSTLRVMAGNLPDHPWLQELALSVSWAQRAFDSTQVLLDSLETSGVLGPQYGQVRCLLALYRGRLREWERCGSGDINTALAELRYGGDTARVRDLVDSFLAVEDPPPPSYPMLISVLAEMGRLPEAHRVLTEWEERFGPDDPRYRMDVGAAAGSIAMAEGRPDSAVTAFLAWNRSGFLTATHVYNRGLAEAANAHDRAGRPDSAVALYERALATPSVFGAPYEVSWYPHALRRLGELHESLRNRDQAIDYYQRFIELWKDADPELQPQVEDVRRRLAALVGEAR